MMRPVVKSTGFRDKTNTSRRTWSTSGFNHLDTHYDKMPQFGINKVNQSVYYWEAEFIKTQEKTPQQSVSPVPLDRVNCDE